ncbi:MAG: hypothetical protein IPK75_18605 [Acidobacteria bacterium]|nr:hypothetical protein [Acidobacteriota bacterium]
MSLHTVDCDYAHRLATMLECALLNRLGSWDEGHALLDEYRAACRAAMPDAPTFMGEPVIDDVYTAELVEIDGNTYGLRPNAAHIVKEAMADAGRYRHLFDCPEPFCYRGEVFETKVVADNAIDTDMRKTP